MIRTFIDTNVLASAIRGQLDSRSTPGEVFRRWRHKWFDIVVSEQSMVELERTLRKPYFAESIPPDVRERSVRALQRRALTASVQLAVSGVATHPEDDQILSAVASAEVDYLVTGDKQLLKLRSFAGATIVTAAEFIAILDRLSAN